MGARISGFTPFTENTKNLKMIITCPILFKTSTNGLNNQFLIDFSEVVFEILLFGFDFDVT